MKSNLKKRIIALVLCMALVLSGSIRTLFIGSFQADEMNTEEVTTSSSNITEGTETGSDPVSSGSQSGDISSSSTSGDPVEPQQPVQQEQPQQNEVPQEEPQQNEAPEEPAPVMELTYEDQDMKVTANAGAEGVIPADVTLNVVPILSNVLETEAQYVAVKEQLNRRAALETYDIAGFLAYDICFKDAYGNKAEPNGDVYITIEYKNEVIPEGVISEEVTSVKVMHLMQDKDRTGEITYDMDADETDLNRKAGIELAAESKIKKSVFVTNYFYGLTTEGTSCFTEVWTKDKPVVTPTAEPTKEATLTPTPTPTAEPTKETTPEAENDDTEAAEENMPATLALNSSKRANYYEIEWISNNSSAGTKKFRLRIVDSAGNDISVPGLNYDDEFELKHNGTDLSIAQLQSKLNLTNLKKADGTQLVYSRNYVQCASNSNIKKAISSLALWKGNVVPYIDGSGNTKEGTVTIRGKGGDLTTESAFKDKDVLCLVYKADYTTFNYTCVEDGKTNNVLASTASYTLPAKVNTSNTIEALGKTLGKTKVTKDGKEYYLSGAYVKYQDSEGTEQTQTIEKLNVNNANNVQDFRGNTWAAGDFTLRATFDGNIRVVTAEDEVFLTYSDIGLDTVETVDINGTGINIQMFDYSGQAAIGTGAYTENDHTGNIKYGILSNKIAEGEEFPAIAKGTNKGTSISQWFTNGKSVNHLFLKNVLQDTGYYYYSSLDNYAYLNDNGNFTVYDAIGTPNDSNQYFYQRGNFMPYNQIMATSISNNKNLYDEYGNRLQESDPEYNRTLYRTLGTNNYYFGMYMNANFYQAQDGKYNNSDMIYEFNGDDDLWVYIDGVLVLDIGGIHDSHSGSINFATGVITTSDCDKSGVPNDTTKTLKEMFEAAGVSTENGFTGNTFSDYSSHKIQMFYMERGAGASTLKMKMNLPVLPDGTVQIAKTLGNTDQEEYANLLFKFRMYLLDEDDNETVYTPTGDDKATLADGTEVRFDSDGTFVLKPGQVASFPNLPVTQRYYVEEIGVDYSEYDQVDINQTQIITNEETMTEGVKSGVTTVEAVQSLNFKNYVTVENKSDLKLVKHMAEGQTSAETFEFNVWLENTVGVLVPYSGNYLIGNENAAKTDLASYSTTDGKITIGQNQQILITDLVAGTDFKVTETLPDQDRYKNPIVTLTDCGSPDLNVVGSIGSIAKNKTATVTVLNERTTDQDNCFIKVQKTFSGLTDPKTNAAHFAIKVYGDSSRTDLKATLSLNDNKVVEMIHEDGTITYTWRIDNLEAGRYYVKEEGETVAGYGVATTVNGQSVSTGAVTEVQTQVYSYDFGNSLTRLQDITATIDFDEQNFIVAGLKDNQGYIIWTKELLSVGERAAVIQAVNNKITNLSNFTLSTTKFYSTNNVLNKGIEVSSGSIKLNNDKLSFEGGNNIWNMAAAGAYSQSADSVEAEIEVTNTYTEIPATIHIKKYGSGYSKLINGAVFELYKGTLNEDGRSITWETTAMMTQTVNKTWDVSLTSGYYKLIEKSAPTGYTLLTEDILFKVNTDNGLSGQSRVNLINETGTTISSTAPDMWKLEATGSKAEVNLCIKNTVTYVLPSTGGIGIYWYMIGGVLLMLAASMILYKKRLRGEVLKK